MTTSSRSSNTDDDGGSSSSSRSNHVGILSRIWDLLTTTTLSRSILSSYSVRRYYQLILLSVITIGWFQVLYRSCLEAYMIRGYAIREFGYIIHEFDPYFNYRATEYLYEYGWYEFKTWFDYKVWYPLGRPVGTTIYPGMQVTAVLIKKYIQYGTHGMSINDICCMIPAWFGVCATLATTWLTYEVTSHNVRRKKNQHPTTTITKRRSSTTSQHSYSSTTTTSLPSFDSAFNDIPIVSTIYQYIIIPLVTFLLKVLYYLTGSTWGIQTPRPFDHYEAQKYKQEQEQQGITRSSTLLLLLLQQMMMINNKSSRSGKTGSSRKNGNKKSSSSSSSSGGKGKKKGKLSSNSTTSTSSTDSNSLVESSSTSNWYNNNNTTTSSSSSFGGYYHFRYSSSYDSTYLTPLSCAVCSGMIMSIVPAHLLRSIAGGYDNESIAMTAMVTTFACWTCSLRDWTYNHHNGSSSSHMTTTNEDNNNNNSDHSEGGGRDDDQDDDDDDDDNNNNATTMSSSQKTGYNIDGSIKDIQVRKLPSILIQLLLSYKPSYDEICTILLGICTGLCYFYMVAAWGGYVFVLNMIGIHCTFLVCIGRYSTKLHRAYTCFYIIGTCLAIQVPVVGYTPIKSLEQLGPLLAFCGIQLIELCQIMKRYYRLNTIDTWKVRIIVFGCSAIIGIMIIVALVPTGYFGPISSRVRGLFVKHTKTGNPLVDSVAEHQAASPQAYYQYLNKVCFIAPIGCIMTVLFYWNDSSSFILIYSISAYFFSLKMVRLVLLTAPIASICGGICLGRIATWMCHSLLLTKDELYYDNCNHQNEKNNKNTTTTNKKKTTTAGSSSNTCANDDDDINMNSIFGILSLFYPTSSSSKLSPSGRKDVDVDDDDDDDATPLRANGKVRSSSPAKNGAAASSSKATSATNGSTNGGSKKKYGSSSNKQAEEEQEEEEEVDDVVAAINAANAAAAGSSLSTTIGKKTNPSEWFQRNKQIIGDPIWVRFVRLSVSIMAIYKVIPYFTDFHTMSHQVAKQISHPTIINKAQTRKGDIVIVDDYREAYFWLRDNTPQDARIMAWWDYGYQITGIGNRTTIADGNTWNHEHIALLGRILTSPEKDAHRIARHLADYVLVWAGGGGDDVAKSPHLRRIANSVYRGLCREPTCSDFGFRPERGPTKSMRESLLYKLHSNGLVPNVIADKNRFKEVFSSKYGKVRIYKIMSVSKESKNWVLKNRICDAPGSWFCPGQYPPALTKILDEKQDFMQLEDFNVQKKDGQDDSEYQREYFENLMGTDKNKKNNRARSTSSSGSSSAAKKKATEQKEIKKPVEMDPDDDEISEVDDDDDDDDHEDISSKGRKMKLKLLPPDEVEYINSKWENNEYTTVMYEVINKNAIQQFGYLLSEKPEIAHMRSEDGRGPMFWAYEMNRKEMISILEKVGVRSDRKDIHGKTPIDLAK